MDLQRINQHKSLLDSIQQYVCGEDEKEQIEVWFARELQELLGYARWENFTVAIRRAVDAFKSQGINVDDHFREVTKMITIGKGGQREVHDYPNQDADHFRDITKMIPSSPVFNFKSHATTV